MSGCRLLLEVNTGSKEHGSNDTAAVAAASKGASTMPIYRSQQGKGSHINRSSNNTTISTDTTS
jgi:hypothetical protein